MTITPAPAVAEALGVSRTFTSGESTVRAVRDVTLTVARGEFVAVMGPSGSGKSTLMNLLSGLDEPDAGHVTLDGVRITGSSDDEITRIRHSRMGFVFQAFNLLGSLTVEENVDLPATLGDTPLAVDPAFRAQLLRRLGITDLLQRKPGALSGGQQQRVAIARALVHRPAVVFADEPTGNLDVETGRAVLHILAEAAHDGGAGVVMVTHDPTAASAADRVVFLRNGSVVQELPRASAAAIAQTLVETVR
ncbi:ABC transporter ATP-binding protein [Curtobacterium sp. ISL-83]|uniref:ABC transporter ATP-binding protein n=1 Tax=Curtobacterium sp. ISL-83 TaxID=2819145 RepID=UPI001BE98DB8|nr:ABC transporter ATP-binding protein [Curtobacterium sp. ISL-83]MBT2502412.1 ABC transporter ATP-binding protein [Curtobacterium sp. ISL-83]